MMQIFSPLIEQQISFSWQEHRENYERLTDRLTKQSTDPAHPVGLAGKKLFKTDTEFIDRCRSFLVKDDILTVL